MARGPWGIDNISFSISLPRRWPPTATATYIRHTELPQALLPEMANAQITSPLFALPREVRDIIYHHTTAVGRNSEDQFGGEPTDVAVVRIKGCAWEDNYAAGRPRFSHSAVWVRRGRARFPGTHFLFGHSIWMSGMGDILHLILTCRLA